MNRREALQSLVGIGFVPLIKQKELVFLPKIPVAVFDIDERGVRYLKNEKEVFQNSTVETVVFNGLKLEEISAIAFFNEADRMIVLRTLEKSNGRTYDLVPAWGELKITKVYVIGTQRSKYYFKYSVTENSKISELPFKA